MLATSQVSDSAQCESGRAQENGDNPASVFKKAHLGFCVSDAASNGRDKPVAALRDRLDISRFTWIVLERSAQLRNRMREDFIGHESPRPDTGKNLFF